MPDNPNYPWDDWVYEVRNGDTRLGYDEWVKHQQERDCTCDAGGSAGCPVHDEVVK